VPVITDAVVVVSGAVHELELHEQEHHPPEALAVLGEARDDVINADGHIDHEVDHLKALGAVGVAGALSAWDGLHLARDLLKVGVSLKGGLEVEEVVARLTWQDIVKGEQVAREVDEGLKEGADVLGDDPEAQQRSLVRTEELVLRLPSNCATRMPLAFMPSIASKTRRSTRWKISWVGTGI
jgi:hypothetical protein